MIITSLLLLITFLTLYASYLRRLTEWKNPPPGPHIYPIIGNIPTMVSLDSVPYRAFLSLSKMYGKLTRLCIVRLNMLVISDFEVMKQAFNNEELDDRMMGGTTNYLLFEKDASPTTISFLFKGILRNADLRYQWRELRRFMLKSLRDLGFGKAASEDAILHEAQIIVEAVNHKIDDDNGVVNLGNIFNYAALNVVWNLIAGSKYNYDDQRMNKLIDAVGAFMVIGKDIIGKPLGSVPWLRHLPPFRNKFQRLQIEMKIFRDFIKESIDKRKEIQQSDSSCFIDMFLEQSKKDTTGLFTEEQLVHCCIDLFIGGSETTSKSQEFLIAHMMLHPHVQARVHAELDAVTNGKKWIELKDKENVPYTEAVLNEAWRLTPVAPMGPPRFTHKEVMIGGYAVPKGTAVMYNTHALNMDESDFKDPDVFRPERFLVDGKFEAHEKLFPFGIGRRRCLGETLARMETFLFFSNLLLNFKFTSVDGEIPDLGPEAGFTNGPYPFKCHITRRI